MCVFLLGFAFTSGDSGLSNLHCPTEMPSSFFYQVHVASFALFSEAECWSLAKAQEDGYLCWVQFHPCPSVGLLTFSVHGQSRA